MRCWFALQLAASSAAVLICWLLGLRLALRESPVAARHTTHYYACAHVFESEIAIVIVSYRIVGLELVGTVVSEAFGNAVIMQQQ